MRTTLKRGIGRGANGVANGNGNGNGYGFLPPAAPSPITRYKQPDPPRRGFLAVAGRIFAWLILALLIVAGGVAGGTYLWAQESVAQTAPHSTDVKAAAKRLNIALPGQPTTALVVGYDHRAGIEKGLDSRSDTIMLVRADPQGRAISLLSFPRDLIVDVSCPGKPSFRGRINSAYAECGSRGTLETVRKLTGLPINFLITVNFHGFKQVVDRLGGVWIDVDRRYFNDNAGAIQGVSNYATINLHAGYQLLNGSNALDYVRFRHTDSDLYRLARQQAFVKGMKLQAANSVSVFKLPGLVSAIVQNTEIGEAGGKGISIGTLKSYALFAYGLPAGHFFQSKIGGLSGYAELHTDSSNVQAAVREFTTPDIQAPRNATNVALGRKPRRAPAPRAQDTSVIVLNGNGITGSASNAGYQLGQRGYRVIVPPNGQPANAPRFDYFRSKVYFDTTQAGSKAAAKKVANLFGDAEIARRPAGVLGNGAMLSVVVGSTFHGNVAPAPVDQTPQKQPPEVVTNPAATMSLVRDAQRKLPFRAEIPTVLEKSSVADSEEAARVYFMGKHRTLRLVFRTGNTEYWGIQESDWLDAPALAGANSTHTLKGRPYDLYYSGPHLHMVVLRQNGAAYWVVNTLLDSLSNETMLAIAKGLRTYGK
ncbi:MAG: LCP family protein [Gaiellaceae bacterium]